MNLNEGDAQATPAGDGGEELPASPPSVPRRRLYGRLPTGRRFLFASVLVVVLGIGVFMSGYNGVLFQWAVAVQSGDPVPVLRLFDQQIYHGCGQTETVKISRPDVTLVGTLYGESSAGAHPAILLMHGSTSMGRELGLYRVLACSLTARGYLVLAADQRDFGDSGCAVIDSSHLMAEQDDVGAWVSYLKARPDVEDDQVSIVAHSMGAGVAMSSVATSRADDPAALVAIGPPRRVDERILNPGAPDFNRFYRREMRVPKCHVGLTQELFREQTHLQAPETYQSYWDAPGHTPLLFVDGESEDTPDRQFLAAYFQHTAPPSQYVSVPDAGHYVGTFDLTPSGSLVLYDRERMSWLTGQIDGWIHQQVDGSGDELSTATLMGAGSLR